MSRRKDPELDAMSRGMDLLSPLSGAQRRRVLSWLAARLPDIAEPEADELPGQFAMFDAIAVAPIRAQSGE